MQGFFAVFLVRSVEQGEFGPVEKLKNLAVWVEGALGCKGVSGPIERSELEREELVTHVVTADEVSALVDDLEVKV